MGLSHDLTHRKFVNSDILSENYESPNIKQVKSSRLSTRPRSEM